MYVNSASPICPASEIIVVLINLDYDEINSTGHQWIY